MMTPRATFVIPAFNKDRWISKAIWSCRNQTIKQIEIIVLNDASTDMTKEIVDWHASEDKRVRAVHFTENRGQSVMRNEGNRLAQSDFIFVLDGDDMATRNRVKDSLAAFQLKKCDLLYGSFHVIDSIGSVAGLVPCSSFDPEKNRREKTNFICHSTMAYSKKVAMDVPYQWEENAKLGIDDWRFQWDAYRKGYKFGHIKNALCYYRSLESGLTKERDNAKVEEFKDNYLATFA